MRLQGLLIAAGVASFLAFLIARVPAAVATRWLPAGVALAGPSGTIWSGRVRSVSVRGRALGAADWSCRPWRLVLLEWSCDAKLLPPGGELSAALSGNFSGQIEAHELAGGLPITYLEGLIVPAGWTGRLEIDLEMLRLARGLLVDAEGRLLVRELKAPGPDGARLGDFELLVGQGAVGTGMLTGRLRDLGGPLRARGTIELKDGRSYLVRGEVAPGPGATDAIFNTLSSLGPPDSLGRRTFAVEGTL